MGEIKYFVDQTPEDLEVIKWVQDVLSEGHQMASQLRGRYALTNFKRPLKEYLDILKFSGKINKFTYRGILFYEITKY